MWNQLKSPNLDPVVYVDGKALNDWYGWCLATVETAFGTPRLYPNAWAAWNATTKKHTDRNWPIGVYFPIWFSGYSGLGHLAFAFINTSGQMNIWTSPYTHTPYFGTGYHNVDVLAEGYLVSYVGWSEDISGVDVINYTAPVAPAHPYTVQSITPKQVVAPNGANLWNLNSTSWANFNSDGHLTANTPVTAVAIAHHNLGGQYYMTDAGKSDGYNLVDMQDYVAPVAPPVVTPPVVAPPVVAPPVEPPVITPVPTPVPVEPVPTVTVGTTTQVTPTTSVTTSVTKPVKTSGFSIILNFFFTSIKNLLTIFKKG